MSAEGPGCLQSPTLCFALTLSNAGLVEEKERRDHLWGTPDLLLGSVSGFIVLLKIRQRISVTGYAPATYASHWTTGERD